MVLLGTVATVIASQAVITGAFSLASRPVQLGYLPRLRVVHTSASTYGQVYMPWINGMLMVAVPILVFAFRSSAALAYAYGMAVTGTITITTMMYLYIARTRWRAPLWLIVIGGGALLGSRRNHPRDRTFRVMEAPDIPRALRVLEPTKTEGLIAIDDASYFLSKIKLTRGGHRPCRHGVRTSSSPRPG